MRSYPALHETMAIGDHRVLRERVIWVSDHLENVALVAVIALFWGVIIYLALLTMV